MELQTLKRKIQEIRQQNVLLDFDLAELYGTNTRSLKQAVNRNIGRFPEDFMFQLTKTEWQEVITNCDNLPSTAKFSPSRPYTSPMVKENIATEQKNRSKIGYQIK